MKKGTTQHKKIINQYGVAFQKQDYAQLSGDGYTWDHGFVSLYMLPQQTGEMTFWQEIGHTWSTTGISNVIVSNTGISMTFSSIEHKWKAIAPEAGSYNFLRTS